MKTNTHHKYRVAFGNGQVHYAGNKSECLQYIAQHCTDGFGYVQFLDSESGEWFELRVTK